MPAYPYQYADWADQPFIGTGLDGQWAGRQPAISDETANQIRPNIPPALDVPPSLAHLPPAVIRSILTGPSISDSGFDVDYSRPILNRTQDENEIRFRRNYLGGFGPGSEGEGLSPDPNAPILPEQFNADPRRGSIPDTQDENIRSRGQIMPRQPDRDEELEIFRPAERRASLPSGMMPVRYDGAAPPQVATGDRGNALAEIQKLLKARDDARAYLETTRKLRDQAKYNYGTRDQIGERERLAQEDLYSRFPSWGGLFNPRPMIGAVGRLFDPRPVMGSLHNTLFPPAY